MSQKRKLTTLPCIVCAKALDDVDSGCINHPYKAVVFTSPGQYGSTVFDPMDSSRLEINVCDDCLLVATKKHQVFLNEPNHVSTRKDKISYWHGEG